MRKTKLIALNALTLAIITVFTFVVIPGPAGAAAVPLVLLAVIVSSVFGGWKNALFSSLAMGVLSLVKNFTMPASATAVLFQNPLVSIVPRMFIGFAVLGTYRLFRLMTSKVKNKDVADTISLTAAGVIAPIVNTGLVFLMIWASYFGQIKVLDDSSITVNGAYFLLLLANFPWEIGVCAILPAPILIALKKAMKVDYMRKREKKYAVSD